MLTRGVRIQEFVNRLATVDDPVMVVPDDGKGRSLGSVLDMAFSRVCDAAASGLGRAREQEGQ